MSRQADSKLRGADEGDRRPVLKKGQQAPWRGFVNVELNQGLKDQFEDWSHTDDPWLTLEGAVNCGMVLSLKSDPSGVGYLAACTQRNPESVNAGYCLTARAGDPSKAWLRLLFILSCMLIDGDWAKEGTVSDPDRW